MLATHSEFAGKYPVATKRVLRAILKAADLCASEPKRVAQLLVDRGYAKRYDYAKTNPNELIAEHTDWRFLDEIKRELKS